MQYTHVVTMKQKVTESRSSSKEIRESMVHLPKWMQGFLTWLTTCPVSAQSVINRSSIYQVLTGFLSMIMGMIITILSLQASVYFLLVIGWLITVSGMRKLQVVIYHHCSHGTVFKTRRANYILGEMLSILLVIKDFATYKRDHMVHHSVTKLLSGEDETAQDLAEIGLLPGIAQNVLWRRLLISFISPIAHLRWILSRVRNCFLSLNLVHNFLAISFWCGLVYFVTYFNIWSQFIIVWLFPLTILYHISRMLRLVAEHRWPNIEMCKNRGRMFVCLSTVAVFNGEALPTKTDSLLINIFQNSFWMIKMIFIHLFSRIFVLVGDTPCHDYHHRKPSSREWANYIYARYDDKLKGSPGYPLNYTEVWGLFNAVDINLQALSEAK